MKTLNYLNYFFVGTPITLGLLEDNLLFWGLLSTILAGIFQIIAGVYLILIEPKNRYLQIYFCSVVFYFGLWYYEANQGIEPVYELLYDKISIPLLIGIPPVLAAYLSVIIFIKAKKTNHDTTI